jgi:hypothetical protein
MMLMVRLDYTAHMRLQTAINFTVHWVLINKLAMLSGKESRAVMIDMQAAAW